MILEHAAPRLFQDELTTYERINPLIFLSLQMAIPCNPRPGTIVNLDVFKDIVQIIILVRTKAWITYQTMITKAIDKLQPLNNTR